MNFMTEMDTDNLSESIPVTTFTKLEFMKIKYRRYGRLEDGLREMSIQSSS